MNFLELQVTCSFCLVFFLRMLGMFMILPVISKYGILLKDASTFLIGLSIGIYGIAQIIFQIPFGILSDKFNRKKIIILGLFMFFLGNIIVVSIHSIWGLIIGRFIQGSGAISGVCMACLSDFIREKYRVKAMALIGFSFALSFLIALITSPILVQNFGFFSLFSTSACLSLVCILIICIFFPSYEIKIYENSKNNLDFFKKNFCFILKKKFFKSYIGIFFLHFLLMIHFMILPHQFELSGVSLQNHWKLYFSTVLFSFIVLFFFLSYCKYQYILDNIIELCIIFLFFSEMILITANHNFILLIIALQIFFISFNFIETFLPAYLSKQQLGHCKGSIMSVYSTSQFLGIALGGIFSGWLYSFLNVLDMFIFESIVILIWFFLICLLKR